MSGANNDDTYVFAFTGDGNDTINETGQSGTDRVQIVTASPLDTATFSNLGFEKVDLDLDGSTDDLLISYNGQSIKVINQYSGTSGDAVDQIQFTNGGKIFGYSLGSGPYALSDDGSTPLDGDDINGVADRDVIASSTAGETLNGGDGNDLLFGNGGVDTINGNDGSDLIVGGAGNDILNGGAGGDVLVGGDGTDTINVGVTNDNARDNVVFTATTDYGDTVSNFDATDTLATQQDHVQFAGTLNTVFDDVTLNDVWQFNLANDAGNNTDQAVDLSSIEALFLDGSTNNGVINANLSDATAVANEFNAEFAITSIAGQDALLVINDTNVGANSFAVWQYTEIWCHGRNPN